MNTPGKIIVGILLIVIGLIISVFGLVILLDTRDIISIGFAIALIAFGLGTAYGGWRVIRGDSIRDLLSALFLGFP